MSWQRFKDWYLGGDPTDNNWRQGLEVVGFGLFPLPGERARMQRARREVRAVIDDMKARRAAAKDVEHAENHAVGMLVPGWLARELPPGSLVSSMRDPNPASWGRFRLYDGSWSPPIESDKAQYRVEYLS